MSFVSSSDLSNQAVIRKLIREERHHEFVASIDKNKNLLPQNPGW